MKVVICSQEGPSLDMRKVVIDSDKSLELDSGVTETWNIDWNSTSTLEVKIESVTPTDGLPSDINICRTSSTLAISTSIVQLLKAICGKLIFMHAIKSALTSDWVRDGMQERSFADSSRITCIFYPVESGSSSRKISILLQSHLLTECCCVFLAVVYRVVCSLEALMISHMSYCVILNSKSKYLSQILVKCMEVLLWNTETTRIEHEGSKGTHPSI